MKCIKLKCIFCNRDTDTSLLYGKDLSLFDIVTIHIQINVPWTDLSYVQC